MRQAEAINRAVIDSTNGDCRYVCLGGKGLDFYVMDAKTARWLQPEMYVTALYAEGRLVAKGDIARKLCSIPN